MKNWLAESWMTCINCEREEGARGSQSVVLFRATATRIPGAWLDVVPERAERPCLCGVDGMGKGQRLAE